MFRNRCLKCKYYKPKEMNNGECHVFPPVPMYLSHTARFVHVFPVVDENNICSYYKGIEERNTFEGVH